MVMVGGHMLSSKGLSVVLGLQTTWLLIWLVLPLVCLHAWREGNGDRDGEGWREEWQVERPLSACWILILGTGYAFVCQMIAGEGLEEAITGATEGLPAWMHPEAAWQRDGPIWGRLDIHTVMSKSRLVSTPKSSSGKLFLSNANICVTMKHSLLSHVLLCLRHYMWNTIFRSGSVSILHVVHALHSVPHFPSLLRIAFHSSSTWGLTFILLWLNSSLKKLQ